MGAPSSSDTEKRSDFNADDFLRRYLFGLGAPRPLGAFKGRPPIRTGPYTGRGADANRNWPYRMGRTLTDHRGRMWAHRMNQFKALLHGRDTSWDKLKGLPPLNPENARIRTSYLHKVDVPLRDKASFNALQSLPPLDSAGWRPDDAKKRKDAVAATKLLHGPSFDQLQGHGGARGVPPPHNYGAAFQ